MRYTAAHKENTHRRIVKRASRLFRAKGLDGPGVAGLMKASGLTVGGFYKHFGSRDDLVVEAIEEGLQEHGSRMIAAAGRAPSGEGWKAIVDEYMSASHYEHSAMGCPIAALASDFSRARPAIKRRLASALLAHRERLLPYMPGRDLKEREKAFIIIFTAMAGAVAIARVMESPAREEIVRTVRDYLLKSF